MKHCSNTENPIFKEIKEGNGAFDKLNLKKLKVIFSYIHSRGWFDICNNLYVYVDIYFRRSV